MNNEMPESVRNFLNYLETIKGRPANTIKGYGYNLSLFFRFYKQHKGLSKDNFDNINISDITIETIKCIDLNDLYAFMGYLNKERNNNSSSRGTKVATLKSFFNYLTNKVRLINFNPALELETPKLEKRLPKHLNLDESIKLLSSIKMDYSRKDHSIRDFAIITLFLNCGMRLAELVSIDISKIKDEKLTVVGKGNKERTIYLNNSCLDAINDYLKIRPDVEDNALFISERNQRIGVRAVQNITGKYISNSGLDPKITTHKLRHTAATLMYQNGAKIRELQEILGHASVSTTEIYTHVDSTDLKKAVNMNPLAGLSR